MTEFKWTKQRQQEWMKQHSLTPEQAKQRLAQKLERIAKLAQAQKKINESLGLY